MITLASDFGTPYPAAMKGVVLDRCDARLVDVAHDFPRQDVRTAAFWLREVLPYFPPAVHLAVVDPGVGTDRAALVVRAGGHALVAPDNGLVLPAARRIAGDDVEVFTYAYESPASTTFHGRDVFAPAAAAVHERGVRALETLDAVAPADEYADLAFPAPERDESGVTGEVLVVDGFGNAITNVPGEMVADRDAVAVDGESVPVVSAFDAVEPDAPLVTVGSHGYAECDVNRGRGADHFGLEPGDAVHLSFR